MAREKSGVKSRKHADVSPKKKAPKLTAKQSSFVRYLTQTSSAREAALLAGYSPNNPDQSAYQAFKGIVRKFPDLMDELGISVSALIQKHLLPLLNATTVRFAQHEGEFTDYVELEDNRTRLEALDMALRMHCAYPSKDQIAKEANALRVLVVDVPRPKPPVIEAESSASRPNDPGSNGKTAQE